MSRRQDGMTFSLCCPWYVSANLVAKTAWALADTMNS
jgi:hypothetical protein